jgi:D-alanyl-D-alanine dipeptidase
MGGYWRSYTCSVGGKGACRLKVMERHGFQQLPTEWWHFDFQDWRDNFQFPPLDIPF